MGTQRQEIPTVRQIVDEKGRGLVPADLEGLIARHASVSRRRGLLSLPLLAALVSAIIAAAVAEPGGLLHLASIVGGAGAVIGLFGLILAEAIQSSEPERARQVLSDLNEERKQTAEALAFAASSKPFALFLRSFQAENRGASSAEVDAHNRALFEQTQVYSHMAGFHVGVPADQLEQQDNSWSLQRRVLAALSHKLPTVMLGNAYLVSLKRADLEELAVRHVTVITGDWWSLFLALSSAAREIVVYADEPSDALLREIGQLESTGRAYTLVLKRALEPALSQEVLEGERRGRISIIRYDDYGDDIDVALNKQWPS